MALLPQKEEFHDWGEQSSPPGLNIIVLPFADDIRHPEADLKFAGGEVGEGACTAGACSRAGVHNQDNTSALCAASTGLQGLGVVPHGVFHAVGCRQCVPVRSRC